MMIVVIATRPRRSSPSSLKIVAPRVIRLFWLLLCVCGLSSAATDKNIRRRQQRYFLGESEETSNSNITAKRNTVASSSNEQAKRRHAYVTLLYGERGFYLPARVLGQSLRDTGTTADLVLLVTPDVPEKVKSVFRRDGWKVKEVQAVQNPNAAYDARFDNIFCKLEIFRLLEYDSVVYMDSDAIALSNIDEMFDCSPFCAVMRHSELFNAGILVVSPSKETYDSLMKAQSTMYSYDGGDQGFLNTYFDDIASCPYFEPYKQQQEKLEDANCRRLPQRYNGDWPIAFLNGKLEMVRTKGEQIPEEFSRLRKSKIMHFSVGSIKPWDWYASVVFPFCFLWSDIAERLPKYDDGVSILPQMVVLIGMIAAVLILLTRATDWLHRQQQRVILGLFPRNPLSLSGVGTNLIVGYTCLACACLVGFLAVPTSCRTGPGWTVCFAYAFFVLFLLDGSYLYRWKLVGAGRVSERDRGKTLSTARKRAVIESMVGATLFVWSTVHFVVHRTSSRPESLGDVIPSLVFMGVFLVVSLMTLFLRLPVLWYRAGMQGGVYSSLPIEEK